MGDARLTYSPILATSYLNTDGGKEMLLQSVAELPSATVELAKEAWENPLDTAKSIAKTAGIGLAFGTVLGAIVPARGPCAAIIAAGFTIPMLASGYFRIKNAYHMAQMPGVDIERIAHSLAKDTVSTAGHFAVGTAVGIAGSEIGRRILVSDTILGSGAQAVQRVILKAENHALNATDKVWKMLSSQEKPQGAVATPTAPRPSLHELENLPGAERRRVLADNRLRQFRNEADDLQMYRGTTHGHSVYSDGMGTPKELYTKAKAEGMDFAAITDHNHKAARGGVKPGDPRFPEQQKTPTVAETPVHYAQTFRDAAAVSKDGEFVGLVGTEVGTIGKVGADKQGGVNHINIFETPEFFETVRPEKRRFDFIRRMLGMPEPPPKPPDVIKINDGDFRALVDHLDKIKDSTGGRPIIQLNHPRYHLDNSAELPASTRGRDYGQKSFKTTAEWRERFGKYASQIEVITGEALDKSGGSGRVQAQDLHPHDYAGYLDKGLKVSPAFGRDFHYGEPGGSPATTGVFAKRLDKPSILEAMRERRTIATTSGEELYGYMRANNQPMGSIIDHNATPDLNVKVKLGGAFEPEARYVATLWGDPRVGDGKLARVFHTTELTGAQLAEASGAFSFPQVPHKIGARGAYYVEVQRTFNGLTDYMWTAPVWMEPLAGQGHNLLIRGLTGAASSLTP